VFSDPRVGPDARRGGQRGVREKVKSRFASQKRHGGAASKKGRKPKEVFIIRDVRVRSGEREPPCGNLLLEKTQKRIRVTRETE